jgi:DNA gyrase subunit A
MPVTELENITRAGRRVLSLDPGDSIARVRCTSGEEDLLFVTAFGQALRVSEKEFRPLGRQARGVRGIRLDEGDVVVGCDVVRTGTDLLLINEKGLGKRTSFEEFTPHHRGGGGVRAMRLGAKTGLLVGSWGVAEKDEILLISNRGRMVRLAAEDIPILGREATGPIVVRLDEGDEVADASIIRAEEEEEE